MNDGERRWYNTAYSNLRWYFHARANTGWPIPGKRRWMLCGMIFRGMVLSPTGLYWWLRVILLSLRWVPRFNLGDRVEYMGREWYLHQGVRDPLWDLGRKGADGEIIEARGVHRDACRKVRTIGNLFGSFVSGYAFYMGAWYSIWVHKGIEPWMRGCNIWARGARQ